MKIMGLDLSITCTGIAYPDTSVQALKPRGKGDARLEHTADHVGLAARTSGAELVVIEGLGGRYLGEASRVIPMLHGAVRLELMRNKIPYMLLSPSSLKKFATGNGSADKTGMALAALKRLGREYSTSDECDADWLRIAGRFAYGLGEYGSGYGAAGGRLLQMPQENLKALRWSLTKKEPIVWPVVNGHKPWPEIGLRD
jgi:Holliday junction resolvasome RuvABC endonuclease subunit